MLFTCTYEQKCLIEKENTQYPQMTLNTGLQWSERVPVSVHVGNYAHIFFPYCHPSVHYFLVFEIIFY